MKDKKHKYIYKTSMSVDVLLPSAPEYSQTKNLYPSLFTNIARCLPSPKNI